MNLIRSIFVAASLILLPPLSWAKGESAEAAAAKAEAQAAKAEAAAAAAQAKAEAAAAKAQAAAQKGDGWGAVKEENKFLKEISDPNSKGY